MMPATVAQLRAYCRLRDARTFYVDPENGDDANDGTVEAPKGTVASVCSLSTSPIRAGDSIALKYGSRFFEVELAPLPHRPISAYGDSNDGQPIIDGSILIPTGDWSQNGTHSEIHQATVTQDFISSQPFSPMLWFGDAGLRADPEDCRATSSTSLIIGTGSKVLTTQSGKAFQVGEPVRIWQASNRSNFMYGLVTAYEGDSLTVNVVDTGGAGMIADWVINFTSTLRGYWDGATIADNLTYVAAHPGTFTCHEDGGTDPDPRGDAGSALVYYINPPDGANPGSSGVPIYAGEHKSVITWTGGQTLRNVTLQRTSTKDLCPKNNSNDLYVETHNCRFLDMASHGPVASPARHYDAYSRGFGSPSGGPIHFFRDTAVAGPSPACVAERCVVENGQYGFYSHGTGGAEPAANESVALTDCQSIDCENAIRSGGVFGGVGYWTVTNHVRTNSGGYDAPSNSEDEDIFINSP